MVVGKVSKKGKKWDVFKIEMQPSGRKVWRAGCPILTLDYCQCKSYPTWREAMAHANGTADLA